jgi:hypothetical protein
MMSSKESIVNEQALLLIGEAKATADGAARRAHEAATSAHGVRNDLNRYERATDNRIGMLEHTQKQHGERLDEQEERMEKFETAADRMVAAAERWTVAAEQINKSAPQQIRESWEATPAKTKAKAVAAVLAALSMPEILKELLGIVSKLIN